MKYLTQTDSRWQSLKIPGTNYSLKSSGCLITALTNIYNTYQNAEVLTPALLAIQLSENNGLTAEGLVIWAAVQNLFNCKVNPDFDLSLFLPCSTLFYIGHIKQPNHFINLLQDQKSSYLIFDTYDGNTKTINKSDIDRIIQLKFGA